MSQMVRTLKIPYRSTSWNYFTIFINTMISPPDLTKNGATLSKGHSYFLYIQETGHEFRSCTRDSSTRVYSIREI